MFEKKGFEEEDENAIVIAMLMEVTEIVILISILILTSTSTSTSTSISISILNEKKSVLAGVIPVIENGMVNAIGKQTEIEVKSTSRNGKENGNEISLLMMMVVVARRKGEGTFLAE